jgi:glucose-1-phosphate cytidylyltransferase
VKTIILAGGRGTRLSEETELKPKPMVEIGGRPILWHIMKIYAQHGFGEFVIALGYRGEAIKRYFLDFATVSADLTVDLASGRATPHDGTPRESWKVHLIDTGLETGTGGRVQRLAEWIGGEPFMLTYGDGVADIDLAALVRFHRAHGRLATVTAVRPPARYGALDLDGDRVDAFGEKIQAREGWINGGFFVLEPGVLDYIASEEADFAEAAEALAREGQLCAYRHEGFWLGMDTLRDVRLLDAAWASGHAPWKTWPT